MVVNINKAKSFFFEKIVKMDTYYFQIDEEKKRRHNKRNEKNVVSREIARNKKIIIEYYD